MERDGLKAYDAALGLGGIAGSVKDTIAAIRKEAVAGVPAPMGLADAPPPSWPPLSVRLEAQRMALVQHLQDIDEALALMEQHPELEAFQRFERLVRRLG